MGDIYIIVMCRSFYCAGINWIKDFGVDLVRFYLFNEFRRLCAVNSFDKAYKIAACNFILAQDC
jgi:hypothetical protein